MEITIWHNPRCSKSRQTLALIEQRGITPHIVRYLDVELTNAMLQEVLSALGIGPRELMRRKEQEYKDLGLGDPTKSNDELIEALRIHPRLIERPIVLRGDRAILGRPPENVISLLE